MLLSADDCNIWDEGSDQEGNIRFDKKRPGVVVGATFNKLVERITSLTDHGKNESERWREREREKERGTCSLQGFVLECAIEEKTCSMCFIRELPFLYSPDIEFVKTFLLTYQSYATPDKLLRKLIERYNVVRPYDMPLMQFGQMRQTIQARVINALRLWVEYGVDFKGVYEKEKGRACVLYLISFVLGGLG